MFSFANKQNFLAQESLEKCYLHNLNVKTGSGFNSKLIKGVYNENFSDNLLFHFNPKFHDDGYIPDLGSVVPLGSKQL